MRTALHYTLLVYPFRHALTSEERLRRTSRSWKPWWNRLDENKLERALDDTYFFVPYVSKLLFPEAASLRRGREGRGTDEEREDARRLADDRADLLASKLHQQGLFRQVLLRLTYDPARLEEFKNLRLEYFDAATAKQESVPVILDWTDVALFPQGVGFLILKARHNTPESGGSGPTVKELTALLMNLRPIHPPYVGARMPVWKPAGPDRKLPFVNQEGLVNFLLQDLVEEAGGRYTKQEEGQVYGQNFRQYTYASLHDAADNHPETPTSASSPPAFAETRQPTSFETTGQRALYELTTCTDTSDADYAPHPEALRRTLESGRIALWANWEGMALHDNVVFLGTSPTAFVTGNFAHNVGHDYFHLYLLTLYQKILLTRFSGELMHDGDDLYRNLRDARALMDRFVRFRNHYWLPDVTLKPQGTAIYGKFRDGLGVKTLFESVSEEIGQLREYYESKAQRRANTILNLIAFVGLPAGVLSQVFGGVLITKDGVPTLNYSGAAWIDFFKACAFTAALALIVYFLWKVWAKRDDWLDPDKSD